MATISICMIVKNEESVLGRCLDSLAGLAEEIIIVDTGSTDGTRDVAAQYTSLIYDFPWEDDFAAARNFSFSKATMEYIYAPDADEILDEENRRAFLQLKRALLPEVEMVQMKYHTVTEYDTVLNARMEYRPKLFRRLREFVWIDAVHETVRLDPVVYDSDIVITHMPASFHGKRDFTIFQKVFARDGRLSGRLTSMYAKELFRCGDANDFQESVPIFRGMLEAADVPADTAKEAACVLARHYRLAGECDGFLKMALRDMQQDPCSEMCYELGAYFRDRGDAGEAYLWFYNAYFETESILDIHTGGDFALRGLIDCCSVLGREDDRYLEQSGVYQEMLEQWRLPEEI